MMEEKNLLPPVGLDVAENSLVNDFGVYWTYGITDTSQFFEEWKSMDCELVAFTLWNLQLFLGGFLLLRHSCTNVLGPKFRISSTIYFHCRKSTMYIVLQALQLIDHVCIIYAKNLSHWPGRTVRKLITSFHGCVILQLMLALMVYFYIWAAYLNCIIPSVKFNLRLCYNLVIWKDQK